MRIAFDCVKCSKSLQLTEEVYKKAYEGHDTCLSCRPKAEKEELKHENH